MNCHIYIIEPAAFKYIMSYFKSFEPHIVKISGDVTMHEGRTNKRTNGQTREDRASQLMDTRRLSLQLTSSFMPFTGKNLELGD